jgi:hypothetical protein
MARAKVKDDPQTQLIDEKVVDDRELEGQLAERLGLKAKVDEAKKSFDNLDDQIRGAIKSKRWKAGRYRIGRHVVVISDVAAKSVAFETKPSTQIRFGLAKDG